MNPIDFPKGTRAFITGAGSGIGRGFALDLARKKVRLVLGDINKVTLLESAEMARQLGAEVISIPCDVSKISDIEAAAVAMKTHFGGIDLLINNAGIAAAGKIGEQKLEDWDKIIGINLFGTVYSCHVFVPMMKVQKHGYVLNVSAGASFISLPEMSAYNLTKAGIVSLTETMHGELASLGINVSALCPTFVKTNLMETAKFSDARQKNTAAAMFENASTTIDQVVQAGLRGVLKNQLMIIPQWDGSIVWRVKRFLPDIYFWIMRNYYSKIIDKIGR